MSKEEKDKHESYGMVGFNRCSGSPDLFATTVTPQNFVSLTIREAEVTHNLGREWHYGGKEIVKVWLSASQFSELITTMNIGNGVPCTIKHIQGKRCEDPPKVKSETIKTFDSFKEDLEKFKEQTKEINSKLEVLSKKKSISKSDIYSLKDKMHRLNLFIESNASFILESFHENTQKVVQNAKTEIDDFIVSAVTKTGLKELQKMNEVKVLEE